MSSFGVVVVISLAAALAFAGSTTLKHISAGRVPVMPSMQPSAVGRFVRSTLSQRFWLAGMACDVVGLGLQVYALHLGALSVVQPLMLSSMLFALVFRGRFEHQPINRRQGAWALVLTVCLGGFLALAATSPGAADESADRIPAIIAGVVGAVLVGALVTIGRRHRRRDRTAALFGTALGIIYASTAALIKAATDIAGRHLPDLFTSWQLYAVIAVGAGGLLLSQLTFQAGPLTASLPATATVDPLLSIVIGVAIYDERIRQAFGTDVLLVILLAVLGTAVVQLSRDPAGSVTVRTADPGR